MTTRTRATDARWRRSGEVAHRVVDDEAVLVDLRNGHYFGLNDTGTVIWERLGEDGATLAELIEAVTGTFAVDIGTAGDDATALLETLVERGLVEASSPGEAGA